jgi:hypothetical protein
MAAANKAEDVYTHDKQKPAEKLMGLNLMINMLSLSTNSNGEKHSAEWAYHLAEVLIIIGEHTMPSKNMATCLLMNYKNSDLEQENL